jgi:putative FmdB family regulatory protein
MPFVDYSKVYRYGTGDISMPIYEYECRACRKTTEVMQKFSDAPLAACPECGGQLKKLISNTSFVLKGTGWYKTDYAGKDTGTEKKSTLNKDAGNKDSGKKDSKGAAETKSESGTDSTKETKTETKKEAVTAS